jgi:ribulose-bisphosphate carboxylase large chain
MSFFRVRYYLESTVSLFDAAENVAIGQSVGNPKVRNGWETPELWDRAGCRIEGDQEAMKQVKKGEVTIAFPLANIDLATDGISQLLCQVMGGQLDIDSIRACHVLDIDIPEEVEKKYFLGPKFGFAKIREFVGAHNKPLLGGIIKPKVGCDTKTLLEVIKQMVEGGCNFIKEDEIMANAVHAPLEERVPLICEYLKDKPVVYCFCINADADIVLDRVKFIHKHGGNGIHVNFWSGLGIYKRIRELDLPIHVHYQKSGISILTDKRNPFHIEWSVVCKLAGMAGVDFIHAGMLGGYSDNGRDEITKVLAILRQYGTVTALSCGMHPGLVQAIRKEIGDDWMANCGGAIHGHPGGTYAGAKAMRQAIDQTGGAEYDAAIAKWGFVETLPADPKADSNLVAELVAKDDRAGVQSQWRGY